MSKAYRSIPEELAVNQSSSAVLSVGSHPESRTDLLAVGAPQSVDYLRWLASATRSQGWQAEVVDDAVVATDGKQRIGIAYEQRDIFRQRLYELADGRTVDPLVKPWTLAPWLPEAFAADLSRAIIVKASNGIADQIEYFKTYPVVLRSAIIDRTRQEIRLKEQLQQADTLSPLERTYAAADVSLAGLRLVHALQSVYFRGVRYLHTSLPLLSEPGIEIARRLADVQPLDEAERHYLGI